MARRVPRNHRLRTQRGKQPGFPVARWTGTVHHLPRGRCEPRVRNGSRGGIPVAHGPPGREPRSDPGHGAKRTTAGREHGTHGISTPQTAASGASRRRRTKPGGEPECGADRKRGHPRRSRPRDGTSRREPRTNPGRTGRPDTPPGPPVPSRQGTGLDDRDTRSEHHGVTPRHRNTRPGESRGRGRKPRGGEGKKRSHVLEGEEEWTGSPTKDATHATTHHGTHFQYPSASKNEGLHGHLIPGSSGKVGGMPGSGDLTSQPDTCIPTRERDPDEYIIKSPSRPPANEKGEGKCRWGPSPEPIRPSSTTVGPMHTHGGKLFTDTDSSVPGHHAESNPRHEYTPGGHQAITPPGGKNRGSRCHTEAGTCVAPGLHSLHGHWIRQHDTKVRRARRH